MPQFTHHKVIFPFPVLTCCAYFRFLLILLETFEVSSHIHIQISCSILYYQHGFRLHRRIGFQLCLKFVRAECVRQRNEVANILGIISLSSLLLSLGFLL